jgi:hypothetical protein
MATMRMTGVKKKPNQGAQKGSNTIKAIKFNENFLKNMNKMVLLGSNIISANNLNTKNLIKYVIFP